MAMDFETAQTILEHAYDDLIHLSEHYSAIVAGIAEAKVKIHAAARDGYHSAELNGVVSTLEATSTATKSAGDALAVARSRLSDTIGTSR